MGFRSIPLRSARNHRYFSTGTRTCSQTVSSGSYKSQYWDPIACVANLLVRHPGLAVALSFKRPPFAARSPLPPRVKISHAAGLAFLGGPRFGLALPVTLRCRSIEPERLVTSSFDRELSTGRVRLPVHRVSRTSVVFQLPFVYMFVWGSSFRSGTWSSGVPSSVRVPVHLGFQLPFVYLFYWECPILTLAITRPCPVISVFLVLHSSVDYPC